MWIIWTTFGSILVTLIHGNTLIPDQDPRLGVVWDRPRLKYTNHSLISILPDPDRDAGVWNASILTDFDNTIPTFDYSNSSGDLASAASGLSGSYAGRGWGAQGRQYDGGDYSKAYMPLITYFDVKCDKKGMHVHVEFNKPFNGIIFSKGFFNTPECRYVPAKSYGKLFDFTVPVDYCGTTGEDHSYDYKDSFFENTLIIQFDEYIQEVWDLAKTIRCEWNAYYDKSVAVRPFSVGNLDPVLYRFNGDNIESWIQVQKGKGPWAEEVYGIVKVGDPLTLVIGIKDYEGKFDMQVKDCFATDGYGGRVQLTDYYGCVVRDKIMSPFRKVKDYGPQATVVAYAYFQAFKFPDRYEVGIKCNIQVCLGKCQGGCPGDYSGGNDYKKTGYSQQEPGYVVPPGYDGSAGGGGGGDAGYGGGDTSYSNVVPTQKVDISQFGPGPYVPDIPPAVLPPPQAPGSYLGAYSETNNVVNTPGTPDDSGLDTAYDTSHVIGLTATVGPTVNQPSSFNVPSGGSKKSSGGAGLEAYRRKRSSSMKNESEHNDTAPTTVTTTDASSTKAATSTDAASSQSAARNAWTHNIVNSGRTAKLVHDDGQINLGGKFKVIAAHDIQSDNINAGPQEVSLAKPDAICIAVSSFTVGVTLFSAILILSVLVTVFVCFRLRRYSEKMDGFSLPVQQPPRKQGKSASRKLVTDSLQQQEQQHAVFAATAADYRIPAVLLTASSNCQQC